jgi:hypothetical protein
MVVPSTNWSMKEPLKMTEKSIGNGNEKKSLKVS